MSISPQQALSPAPESIQEDFPLRLQTQPEVGMSGTTHRVHPKTYKRDLLKTAHQNQESHLKKANVLIREQWSLSQNKSTWWILSTCVSLNYFIDELW